MLAEPEARVTYQQLGGLLGPFGFEAAKSPSRENGVMSCAGAR